MTTVIVIAVIVVSVVLAIITANPLVNLLHPILQYIPGNTAKRRNNIIMFFAIVFAAILFIICYATGILK
jgi:hypothetical protein